jgi:hypothetical protein
MKRLAAKLKLGLVRLTIREPLALDALNRKRRIFSIAKAEDMTAL